MKRIKTVFLRLTSALAALLILGAVLVPLTSCEQKKDDGATEILCTVFPIYDWVRNIVGDTEGVSVRLLVDSGTDMHSYQPSFEDMAAIKSSDAVIYVGGISDDWVKSSISGNTVGMELASLEDIRLYEVSHESADHDHTAGEEHQHDEEFDEHLWLSVKNARVACREICRLLCTLDGENAETYSENFEQYVSRLDGIDAAMSKIGERATETAVFADRFPFVYLFEDYGIRYYAAFDGCSADTSADFETVVKLAEILDTTGLDTVLVTESSDGQLARSAINASKNKNAQIVALDSMQSIGGSDVDSASYLEIMESNVSVFENLFK